jgi:hypothetical protein
MDIISNFTVFESQDGSGTSPRLALPDQGIECGMELPRSLNEAFPAPELPFFLMRPKAWKKPLKMYGAKQQKCR